MYKKKVVIKYFTSIFVSPLIWLAISCSEPNPNLQPRPQTSKEIVEHKHYILQYNEKYELADWVFYEITKDDVLDNDFERSDNFRMDNLVSTQSANKSDYKYSGYDRGHLAPARDMAFSEVAMSESFYFSNIAPQNPSFNRCFWRKVEALARDWAVINGSVCIVTGSVLNNITKFIGENEVGIPNYYYKIILDYNEPDINSIAFLVPNKKIEKHINNYIVSIDSIESYTNIDFFYLLEDNIEEVIEKNISDFK